MTLDTIDWWSSSKILEFVEVKKSSFIGHLVALQQKETGAPTISILRKEIV